MEDVVFVFITCPATMPSEPCFNILKFYLLKCKQNKEPICDIVLECTLYLSLGLIPYVLLHRASQRSFHLNQDLRVVLLMYHVENTGIISAQFMIIGHIFL